MPNRSSYVKNAVARIIYHEGTKALSVASLRFGHNQM